jgi:hypothetical protein
MTSAPASIRSWANARFSGLTSAEREVAQWIATCCSLASHRVRARSSAGIRLRHSTPTKPCISRTAPTGQYDRAIADYRKALTLKIDERMTKEINGALKELGAVTN